MITLVDSSVLLDVMAPLPWRAWSEVHLAEAAELGEIAIDQIVYAEVAVDFATVERLERTLQGVGLKRLGLPWPPRAVSQRRFSRTDAAVARGRRRCRSSSSARTPRSRLTLLMRDPFRVRTYFGGVKLIAAQETMTPG